MKHQTVMLFCWLAINLIPGVLYSMGVPITEGQVDSMDPDLVASAFDPNSTIAQFIGDADEYEVGDPVLATSKLWTMIGLTVASVPTILLNSGMYPTLAAMMAAMWVMGHGYFFLSWIGGRQH